MTGIQSVLEVHRQLLPPGYSVEYRMSCALPRYAVPAVADRAMSLLMQPEMFGSGELFNVKGRDPQTPCCDIPAAWRPKGEELLFMAGRIFISAGDTTLDEEFQLRVQSSFERFEGAHGIVHSAHVTRPPNLPAFLAPQQLGRVFPLQIIGLRLGLELFESRRFLASVGFSPVVTQTLLLECFGDELCLTLTAEGQRERRAFPIREARTAAALDRLTEEFCGTAVTADYRRKTGAR